jgi:hypothetical protein
MDPGKTGTYTLTPTTESEDMDCATLTLAASPIATAQQLAAGDCQNAQTGVFGDDLIFGLPAGASMTATMSSTAFDPQILLYNVATGNLAGASYPGPPSITFTNPAGQPATPYALEFTSGSAATGAYTLTLNITYPAGIRASQSKLNVSSMRIGWPRGTGAGSASVGAYSSAWLQ